MERVKVSLHIMKLGMPFAGKGDISELDLVFYLYKLFDGVNQIRIWNRAVMPGTPFDAKLKLRSSNRAGKSIPL